MQRGFLTGIWTSPQAVRDLRALIAQRNKITSLETQSKNRLHATLHRYHLALPEASPFAAEQRKWWLNLPVSPLEKVRLLSDLDTLVFAQQQVAILEQSLAVLAAKEPRLPLLAQLPGINWLTTLTILAAVGDISRFPQAKNLVGYTGLGARMHDSGLTTRTGRITKTGRKDLRAAMIEAAHKAASTHPHWQAELARLEPIWVTTKPSSPLLASCS
jgi:transposase